VTGIRATSPAAFDPHRGAMPLLRQTSTFRGVFFFVANLAGYVAANGFLYYLSTGRFWDFTIRGYREALVVPLSEIMVRPPSIFSHPWMIPVTGLVLGVIAFVPAMLAVLYRQWVSLLFVAAVAVFGHAPFLAACLALGCVVASRTRLRSNLPFLALTVGLTSSVTVYVTGYLLVLGPAQERVLLPFQRLVFYLPIIVALVSVVIAGAAVLGLARLTRYRPGVIWPVLLVLLAAPGWLFWEKVGPAELDYALIDARVAPGDVLFNAGDLGPPARAQANLDARRRALTNQCRAFLLRHQHSGRGEAVKWIQATIDDVQIDPFSPAGEVRLIYAGPSRQSEARWRRLIARFPDGPQAMVGRFRLAVLAFRDGRVVEGGRHLDTAQNLLVGHLERQAARPERSLWQRVFTPMPSLPGEEYYRSVLFDVQRVAWLMEQNGVSAPDAPAETVQAFADYVACWPFVNVRRERIEELAAGHAKTPLADNFRLQAALMESDELDRAEALAEIAGGLGDAAIVANYELGRLGWRIGDSSEWTKRKLKDPAEYFKLVTSAPDNPYRVPAERHAAWLAARGHPTP